MSRCVVYQSGGFTNYGISYRKYSQEELEEIKKEDVKRRSTGWFGRNQEEWIVRKCLDAITGAIHTGYTTK